MYDLAETLGMPVGVLSQSMTERELTGWMLRGKPLAWRRVELYLAQIAQFIAVTTGNRDVTLKDTDLFGPLADPLPDGGVVGAAHALDSLANGMGVVILGAPPKPIDNESIDPWQPDE